MPPTYILARDHLQRAAAILRGADPQSRQLRDIIERTVSLMDEMTLVPTHAAENVLDFVQFKARSSH